MSQQQNVVWLEALRMSDLATVGGKNASLGEMINQLAHLGVRVPGGFATTAAAYRDFLSQNDLDKRIWLELDNLAVDDVTALAATGARVRQWIMDAPLPWRFESDVRDIYGKMQADAGADISWAIRSSATAEDLPEASFAGQQETFLNIYGVEQILAAIRRVFASLFNDRAIAYRTHQGFRHQDVALSACVQRMVRSDIGASGVMFTLDTESGFDQVVLITSAYGLGETVVQGAVNPDEFYVYKPALRQNKAAVINRNLGSKEIKMIFGAARETGYSVRTVEVPQAESRCFSITDAEAEELARYALLIEQHYGRAMDIEWGKDGLDGKLYILQARPETVQVHKAQGRVRRYRLRDVSQVLVSGRAVGQRIGGGSVCVVENASKMNQIQKGDVLVTDMTDPDWEPVMKRAAAIVTNRGGRTCHAAIVARELGIPAVVGCGDATQTLRHGNAVTVSCAEGEIGKVYEGMLDIDVSDLALDQMPVPPIKLSLNVASPELAFESCLLPNAGVGLARLEFIIARMIGVHPNAVLDYPNLPLELKEQVEIKAAGYASPIDFYVEKLVEGMAMLGAAFAPKPVIVRFSDFKSNEYSRLLGGSRYEPDEENPMIGVRGASRYIWDSFRGCFALECRAIRRVRDEIGLTNIEVMIPFVRTLDEARLVIAELAANGLRRGDNGLRVIMMCEIPSNALLADQFLEYFDGFSIGSNDLTQLTLGIDRESGLVAGAFDERNQAVKELFRMAIQACRRANKYIGVCGQGPSDYPDLAQWLVEQGVEAISLNPDTIVETWLYLAERSIQNRR